MNTQDIDHLAKAKRAAQADWERLDAEARAIRAQLTAAERKARAALRVFERARLDYLNAPEGPDVQA